LCGVGAAVVAATVTGVLPAGSSGNASLAGRAGGNGAGGPKKRRLLVFTKSSGFEHSVVKRGTNGEPSLVERTLTEMGARDNFEVVCTKDGRVFTPENLRTYDAIFFYTTGDLTKEGTDKNPPMTPEASGRFWTRSGTAKALWARTRRQTRSTRSRTRRTARTASSITAWTRWTRTSR
jgi:hypothetical protein